MSFTTRYLDFEISYHYLGHVSNKVMHHVFNNVNNVKKIYFPTQKHICHGYTLEKIY